ncbi:MAG: DUF5011 domain-containing protein [Verrucomicrobia bacterium]|nr:DUF5011 domain-containing protein [Verrucomicrobiota bacterium]
MKNNLTKNPRSSGCESVHFFRLFRQTARLAHGPSGFRFPTLLSLFVIFVIWILLASEGVSGNPVVVTSNLGPNDTSSGFLGGFAQEAVLFTIPLGSLPINVTSIETPVTGFSSGLTLSVGIADTGHNSVFGFRIPGNILEAANQFVPQGGSSGQGTASMLVKFDLSGNTVLQPGQDYWVVWEVTPLPVASGPFRLYESPFEPDARFVRGYMSTDPDDWITCNCAPHHNPAFRVNGIISQLDLVANTLTWDAIARQVNFSYNVNGGSLPVATTTAFYWGTGPTWADVLPGSQPIYTTPIAPGSIGNSGPLFVDAAALGVPQAGATHLILVLDPPSANSPNGLINETNKGNNVQAMQICSVGNVTRLPQSTNPIDHWGNEQYAFHDPTDPKGYTIGVWGCALTSLCMVLNSINVNVVSEPDGTLVPNDPGYLNDFMKNHPGSYSAINDVVFESAVGFLNYELNLSLNFNSYLNGVDVNGSSKVSDLLDVLCAGHAVIVHVPPAGNPFSPTFGHYVVVTGFGVDNGILNLLIADPSSRNYQALSDFGMFQIRGWVEDLNPPGGASGKAVNSASSAVDLSQANFFAGDNVDVLVTDPNGLRTGFDPISGQVLKEIPDSSYSRDFFVNDPNGDIVTAITHLVHIFHPRQGSYQVVVTGLSPGSFDLSLGAFNQDGTPHPLVSFQGFADIGSTASFSFPLVVATNNPPVCHAGGPYTVECQGSTTTLQIDGSGSSDPDGDAFTYSWASDCPGASFDDPTAAQPMLTVDSSTIPVNCNVTLTVTDSNGLSSSCTTTVTIVDTTPPIITLNGANPLSIACQSTFTDPGATAFDISAGSISVITSGTVDVNTPGNYTLRYTATDPSGNTAVATRIVSVSCNNQASGTPLVWGEGSFGQLGDGNFYSSPNFGVATAVQVSGLNGAVAIAGGDSHSVALKADGTVWAWGEGFFGQLGNGSFSNSATPVQVGALSGVAAVASGSGCLHSLALKVDGTAWAWGNGRYGQLGDGNFYTGGNSGVAVPVQVSGLVNVRALAGGFQHSVALKADGTVWAWGDGILGQLGDGNFYTGGNSGVAVPVQVSGLTGAVAISGGFWHSVALKTDGTVWAWGDGQSGQLGDCNFRSHATPVQVSAISGAVAIAAGGRHSLALKSDGTVWAWGDGTSGQLGNGTSQGSCTPVQVSNLSGVVAIAGGAKHNLALKTDGTVWSWGDGYYGELGDGNFYRSGYRGTATPVLANSLAQPVRGIACGGSHSLALPAAANTPLAITCPSDTSVNNDPGQCSAAVNYPIPITSGGSGNVTVVCNPPSGSNFPVGTNIVSCTATDSAGNAATCSFKVTVQNHGRDLDGRGHQRQRCAMHATSNCG